MPAVYQSGEIGRGIKSLQAALLAQGWGEHVAGFSATGTYDAATVETVRRFMAGHNISAPSEPGHHFGPQCWEALFPPADGAAPPRRGPEEHQGHRPDVHIDERDLRRL